MSYRTKARRLATNNREYKSLSLDGLGKCKYCPPHKGIMIEVIGLNGVRR